MVDIETKGTGQYKNTEDAQRRAALVQKKAFGRCITKNVRKALRHLLSILKTLCPTTAKYLKQFSFFEICGFMRCIDIKYEIKNVLCLCLQINLSWICKSRCKLFPFSLSNSDVKMMD